MKMPNRYTCKMDTLSGNDDFCHDGTLLDNYGHLKCMLYSCVKISVSSYSPAVWLCVN